MSSKSGHELGQAQLECTSDGLDVSQREVPLAALDTPHVGPVKLTGGRKPLLGVAPLFPERADSLSESLEDVRSLGHPQIGVLTMRITPRTMSII